MEPVRLPFRRTPAYGEPGSILTRLWAGRLGFDSRRGQCKAFFLSSLSRPYWLWGPTHPIPIRWVPGGRRVKLTTHLHAR
jgi:hypothetical protein